MLNDFWFLKAKPNESTPESEDALKNKYRQSWRPHLILYAFSAIVFWPFAIVIALWDFVRRTTDANRNYEIEKAYLEGRRFKEPEDNRFALYFYACVIVAFLFGAHWTIHFIFRLIGLEP